ncbi:polysaccharide deacetylase family protein [Metabacillus arenae]|uniref:polysaccharide deacetylase family protein n=1 Tax=Metabacillus arenae TaxID=2771434 RepID=UPI001CD134AB|nr:polysaccharide deacetylase family protein [Metabacillus arenae]
MFKLLVLCSVSFMLLFVQACSSQQANQSTSTKESKDEAKVEERNESNQQNAKPKKEEKLNEEDSKDLRDNDDTIEPQYEISPETSLVKPLKEGINEKVVLLTIDDAPDQYALEMAKHLKDLDVKAIFFVNGHFLRSDEEKEILKKIHSMGFPIGNHTMTHQNLNDLTKEQQRKEIIQLNQLIKEVTGEKPRFFRAPFGENTETSKKIIEEEQMIAMNWTYGYDWESEYQNKEALTKIMVDSPFLTNGANLLMHDRVWTRDALPDIVKGLQNKGYTIVDPALIKGL